MIWKFQALKTKKKTMYFALPNTPIFSMEAIDFYGTAEVSFSI